MRLFSSPEPCSVAGPPRSVAVDSRICFTTAGEGVSPPCAFRYAWMTSAAAPATSGAASLVPPDSSTGEALPRKLTQSAYSATSAVQEEKDRSPGATRSRVRPSWVNPPLESELMLSFSQPSGANLSAPA